MKKHILTIWLFIATTIPLGQAQIATQCPAATHSIEMLNNVDGNDLIACINLASATIANYHENYESNEFLSSDSELFSWTKSFMDVYLHSFLVTLCHELGHALAAKLLTNSPINIHLGTHEASANPLMRSPSISIESFNPYIGYAQFHQPESQGKELIILLAGGTSGLIAHIILKALKIFLRTYKDNHHFDALNKIKSSLHDAVTQVTALDFIAGMQLANVLIPMGNTSDAAKLWRIARVPEHLINLVNHVGPYMTGIILSIAIHVMQKHQRQKA